MNGSAGDAHVIEQLDEALRFDLGDRLEECLADELRATQKGLAGGIRALEDVGGTAHHRHECRRALEDHREPRPLGFEQCEQTLAFLCGELPFECGSRLSSWDH